MALAVVTYARLPANEFVDYDDGAYLTQNPYVNRGFTLEGWRFAWAVSRNETGNWHPLTWLSHMFDCQVAGLRPGWHHGVNLALHAANGVLLFLLLARMTGSLAPSAVVAALFLVHPVNVESVAWAAERKNVLSTLFWLLATGAYLRYSDSSRWTWYLVSCGWFALGLLSKPMLVTWPFTLLLWDYWPLGRSGWVGIPRSPEERNEFYAEWWPLWLEKIPLFVLSAVVSGITLWSQAAARTDFQVLPLGPRLGTMVVGYVRYLGHLLWPVDLVVLYPFSLGGPPIWQVVGALMVLAAISLAVAWPLRQFPFLLVGWCWYLGTLFPVAGLIQIGRHALADRYLYVPAWGLFVMLVFGAAELARRGVVRAWPLAASTGIGITALAAISFWQVGTWRDQYTLFQHALDAGVVSAEAHYNVAIELYRREKALHDHDPEVDRQTRPQLEQQIRLHLREAVRLAPDELKPRLHLARVLLKHGSAGEAIREFNLAVQIDPQSADAVYGRAMTHYALEQFPEAVRDFQKAVALDPDFSDAHYNLAKALLRLGRTGEGIRHLRKTMSLRPEDVLTRAELAALSVQLRRLDEAIELFREIVRLQPESAAVHYELALRLQLARREAEAIETYRRALELDADFAPAANNLAWIFATTRQAALRDGPAAVDLASRACRLTQEQNASYLDTLAAAHARSGQFAEAVRVAEQSVELAVSQGQVEQATKVQERLNRYRTNEPFEQPPG